MRMTSACKFITIRAPYCHPRGRYHQDRPKDLYVINTTKGFFASAQNDRVWGENDKDVKFITIKAPHCHPRGRYYRDRPKDLYRINTTKGSFAFDQNDGICDENNNVL